MTIHLVLRSLAGGPAMPYSAHTTDETAKERIEAERRIHAAAGISNVYFIGPVAVELED